MSRVDESRSEKRAEEARLAERRVKEQQQQQKRGTEASVFDRRLAMKSSESARPQQFGNRLGTNSEATAREPKSAPPESALGSGATEREGRAERGGQTAQNSQRAFSKKLADGQHQLARPPAQGRPGGGGLAEGRSRLVGSNKQGELSSESKAERGAEARAGQSLLDSETGSVGGRKKGVGRSSDDAASTGREKGGEESKETGTGNAFRLPPAALMAPPPVARPRDVGGARAAMMKEMVDKIVSRVLVGTNSQGIPEFRLDLKSSVLKGLSIKISGGRGGKIRAVFSGSDQEVLDALEESSQELVDALKARGLTLEELVVEGNRER